MLLDKQLILFDGNTSDLPATGNPVNWIDTQGLGIESSELMGFILFKTECDTPTFLTLGFYESANADFSSPSAIPGVTGYNGQPATTAVPAGSLFAEHLGGSLNLNATAAQRSRYVGLYLATIAGSGAADEEILAWVGRRKDVPMYRQQIN